MIEFSPDNPYGGSGDLATGWEYAAGRWVRGSEPFAQHRSIDDDADEPAQQLESALLDTAGLDGIPEPEPLVRGVLFADSLAWIIGAPGDGKSFVALDIAGSVATGTPWQGCQVTQGKVLSVVAEGLHGLRPRVRAWEAGAGTPMEGVDFLPLAVQAGNDGQWRALVELVSRRRWALVILDTQARTTVGLEENSAKDMGRFVQRLDALRKASGACVAVVHHQGRTGEHMRGSTALEGAANTVVRVTKCGEIITFACAKQKDAAAFDDITLRLVPHGLSAYLSLTDPSATLHSGSPAVRQLLSAWWDCHETDWVSVTTLVESKLVSKPTFYRVIKDLVRAGMVEETGEKQTRRYRLPKEPWLP